MRVPAHLVGPVQRITSLFVELEPLLAAAIGHPAVQRHVAVVRLRRLVDGQLGLLRSEGGSKGRKVEEKARAGEIDRKRETCTDGQIETDRYLDTAGRRVYQ